MDQCLASAVAPAGPCYGIQTTYDGACAVDEAIAGI
jgi:hypothetical protein